MNRFAKRYAPRRLAAARSCSLRAKVGTWTRKPASATSGSIGFVAESGQNIPSNAGQRRIKPR
jgi:hypothetical protein